MPYDYDGDGYDDESGEQMPTEPGGPAQGDASHRYVTRDSRGDVWQMDDGDTVLEWAVFAGEDSRSIIPGSLRRIPIPAAPVAVFTPAPASAPQIMAPNVGDPAHKYVGTDTRGDVYQLFDGNNVIEWAVQVGADSRNIIPGSARNLGAPSAYTVAQAPQELKPLPAFEPANPRPPTATPNTPNPGSYGPPQTMPAPSAGVPGSVLINAAPPANLSSRADPRHVYVGRDTRGDVWQIFDGTNVLEWASPPGTNSGQIVPGTLRNLGAPSAATIAQNDGTLPAAPSAPTAPAGSEKSAALVYLGIAASILSALK
jgi:hypothetical protein